MSRTINVEFGPLGTYPALVGLDWDCVPANEWSRHRKRLRDTMLVTQFPVRNHLGKEVCFGTSQEIDKTALKKAKIALAATLATTFPEGRHSIVEKIDADQQGEPVYWFVALTDGRVVYGTDISGDESRIIEELHTHLSMADADDQGELVHGSASSMARGLIPDDQIQESAIGDLVSRDILKRSQLPSGLTGSLKELSPKAMAATAAIVLSSAYFVVHWWPDSEPQRPVVSGEERRAALEDQARQALAEKLDAMTTKTSLSLVGWITSHVVGQLPVGVRQWEIQNTICDGNTCSTTYVNNGNTLPGLLRGVVGQACSLTFEPSAKEATCRQDITGLRIQKDQYASFVIPNARRDRIRDHLMTVVKASTSEAAYGLSGFSPVSFDNSQMIASEQIPDKNTFQTELALADLNLLAQSPLRGQAPIAIERIEIDWQSLRAKASGYFYGEATQ